jgi:hypothetical protein
MTKKLHEIMGTKRVGELNGPWAFLFKITQLFFPLVVAWCVWATNQLHQMDLRQTRAESWMAQGPRFTSTDADRLRLQILEDVGKEAAIHYKLLMDELKSLRSETVEMKIAILAHIKVDNDRDTKTP